MATKGLVRFVVSRIPKTQKTVSLNHVNIKFYSAAVPKTDFEHIKTQKVGAKSNVGVIQLHRPKALNALCEGLIREIAEAMDIFEADNEVGAIVITGNEKVFAAGADVKEMINFNYAQALREDVSKTSRVGESVKPVIAAVNGFCFGFGCELAMMCDIIYAGENARFAQPEVTIGTIPGGGGTQRLIRSVGKSKAMEMVFTGYQASAEEAEKMGLVSKVFPVDKLLPEAIKLAEKIARNSPLINAMCKESMNVAYEMSLREGLHFEKRMFHGTFATKDLKEGMDAFLKKRAPNWVNE